MRILQINAPNWVSGEEAEHGWQYSPSLRDIPRDACISLPVFLGSGRAAGIVLVDLDHSCSELIYCAPMKLLVKPKALVEIQ